MRSFRFAPLSHKTITAPACRLSAALGANKNMKHLLVVLLVLGLSGCCMFVPCHPETRTVGYVSDENGKPIEGATIRLYGYKSITNSNGCFAFDVADALPFELSASAEGFKSITVPSKAGYFIISINLASASSNNSSVVEWKEISSNEYRSTKNCT